MGWQGEEADDTRRVGADRQSLRQLSPDGPFLQPEAFGGMLGRVASTDAGQVVFQLHAAGREADRGIGAIDCPIAYRHEKGRLHFR